LVSWMATMRVGSAGTSIASPVTSTKDRVPA
jgi:hypothetical protein